MKNSIIIFNPHSGRGNHKIDHNKIKSIFLKYGYSVKIVYTEYKGHAKDIIKKIGYYDLVISIGGDGTFNEIMTGNIMRKNRLIVSHIPIGTTNDIGFMYGYGKDIYENIKLLLSGQIKKMDICLINDIPFVYVAGFGKFVNVSYDTPRDLKKKYGYLAYIIMGLKELNGKTKMYDIGYIVNGKKYKGEYSFILISNANRIAGINHFYKNIKLNDNKFEILFCSLNEKKEILRSLYYLKRGDITLSPGFKFYKTDKIKIIFNNDYNKSWSVDGEKLLTNDIEYEIKIERGINIMLPSKNIGELFIV